MSATIIVCSDGSDLAIRAALVGLSILRPAESVLVATVVDAVDPYVAYDGSGHAGPVVSADEVRDLRRRLLEQGRAVVERTIAELGLGDAASRILEGRPGEALCHLASELSARALVIGSRGRGGVKRALLGSVSDFVVRNASCPVVVIGDAGQSEPR
jgi:nucleotide-binding universal stress UspA family protein